MKPRILIVDSLDDEVTRERHRLIANSPRLVEYEIAYAYALEAPDDEKLLGHFELLKRHPIKALELLARLERRLATETFQFVLIHTGVAFGRHSDVFFEVVRKLRAAFPAIGFAFQERPGLVVDPSCLDPRHEVDVVQKLIFRDVLGV